MRRSFAAAWRRMAAPGVTRGSHYFPDQRGVGKGSGIAPPADHRMLLTVLPAR